MHIFIHAYITLHYIPDNVLKTTSLSFIVIDNMLQIDHSLPVCMLLLDNIKTITQVIGEQSTTIFSREDWKKNQIFEACI
jgi:hypothetical protein